MHEVLILSLRKIVILYSITSTIHYFFTCHANMSNTSQEVSRECTLISDSRGAAGDWKNVLQITIAMFSDLFEQGNTASRINEGFFSFTLWPVFPTTLAKG